MAFLTPLALLGLLLVPGVVALHLHRRRQRQVEIPSLLLWENLGGEPARGGKSWRLEHILFLLLQLIAVCALVFSLARLANSSAAPGSQVYVLDRGVLMTAADPAPSRFAAARGQVVRAIQGAAPGTAVTIILADAQPRVLVSTTDPRLALQRLEQVSPVDAGPDLEGAIRLGSGFVGRGGHLHVLYARGEALPPISASAGVVSTTAVGAATDDQSIARFAIRCTAAATTCDALATLRNLGDAAVREDVVINADGVALGRESITLPANSATDLSFAVPATRHMIELYLAGKDLVSSDNVAWAMVPGPVPATVTVVGTSAHTAPIVRALSALPGIRVTTLTPSRYRSVASGTPGLLVLAGWMPAGGLPPSPSLLLVDPPRFPGVPAPTGLSDTSASGEDASSPLLDGVDLTSLDLPSGSGEQLALPPALHPVVWAAHGPLIAAGVLDGRRVVTMAFDPKLSNLSQLTAFPILMDNILRWSADWLPPVTVPGARLAVDVPPATSSIAVSYAPSLNSPAVAVPVTERGTQAVATISGPGVYTVSERGSWGVRSAQVAANVAAGDLQNTGSPIVVSQTAGLGQASQSTLWWPFLGLIAAFAIALEWLLVTLGARGRG